MGTPEFSVGTLESLIKAGHDVTAVITQPDKPKGRGKSVLFTPVKEAAMKYNIPVLQPVKVRDSEFVQVLRTINPDVIVVVAFGQILPIEIIEMPKYGCVNVHGSLLPKYRGAAPIQWAVISGEKESGVTTIRMDVGIDTGDMIMKTVIPISEDETGGSLYDKLRIAGAKLCVETLKQLEDNTAIFEKQGDSLTDYAKILSKSHGNIDWNMSAESIERLIRGLNPWPSAYSKINDKTLKIWKAKVIAKDINNEVGTIVEIKKDSINVQTGKGMLAIMELQLEGKKRMPTEDFLRGIHIELGTKLGVI
jgi:methionyl-tRNA formyltransferase